MNRLLLFWIAAALVFAGVMILRSARSVPDTPVAESEVAAVSTEATTKGPKLTEFELLDQTGQRVHTDSVKGRVWTGSFFFCSCPSTCYNQNMKIAELQAEYGPKGLVSMSITCDPANDNSAALARYASRFNADFRSWKFLTPIDGDVGYVQRIGNDFFNVMVGEETHTDRVMVVDRQGKVRGAFSVLKPEQFAKLRELVAELIAETPSEDQTDPQPTDASPGDTVGDQASS